MMAKLLTFIATKAGLDINLKIKEEKENEEDDEE